MNTFLVLLSGNSGKSKPIAEHIGGADRELLSTLIGVRANDQG